MCCLRTLKTILNTKRKPITSNCLFRVCTVCVHPSKTPPDVRIKNNFASKHSTWPDRNIYTEKSLPVSHTLVCSRKRDRENLDVTAVLLRFTPKKSPPPPPKERRFFGVSSWPCFSYGKNRNLNTMWVVFEIQNEFPSFFFSVLPLLFFCFRSFGCARQRDGRWLRGWDSYIACTEGI